MKVWIIGRNYPQLSNRMSGSFELEQAKMLASKGLEVYYLTVCLHPVRKIRNGGIQLWEEDGVLIFSYSKRFVPRMKGLYFGRFRDRIWNYFLREVENKVGKPDVIHLHYPIMMLLANVMKKYHDETIKIVVTEHWSKVLTKQLDSYELKQQKKYVDFVDSYICVGNPLRNSILEMTNSKREILIVPNIINQAFKPKDIRYEEFTFIVVGRLVKIKQVDKIIMAFSKLFKGNIKVKLVIVGGGEEENNLKMLVQKLYIEDQVNLVGSLNRIDTASMVSEAACLICYSEFETFGVPIIEAWACGIPSIVTTSVSVMSKFDEKLGIEISPNDFEGLKNAMLYVYEHQEHYDKNYIVNFAINHFSEDVIANRLIEIYKKI